MYWIGKVSHKLCLGTSFSLNNTRPPHKYYSNNYIIYHVFFLSPGANSKEFDAATAHPVVIEMPEHHPGDMGGTMRLGLRETRFRHKDTVIGSLVGRRGFE